MLPARLLARSAPVAAALLLGACSPEQRSFSDGKEPPPPTPPGGCEEVEVCFNGVDDDCDGSADCGDSDCGEGAVCVPSPASSALGVVVGENEPCPAGFTADESLIYRGLQGGGCEGCGCTANPTTCQVDVWIYASEATCNADAAQTGGTPVGKVGMQCTMDPLNGGTLQFGGVRIGDFEVIQTCESSGTAAPVPATWQETMKFCRATEVGIGCGPAEACVPKEAPASQCALVSGGATCEGYGASQNDWFTGYSDTRSCSSCGCNAVGGNCNNVQFELGNDYSCFPNQYVWQGEKWCGYAYSPPARLVGQPVDGTCEVDVGLTGSLDPTGQSTLCCLE